MLGAVVGNLVSVYGFSINLGRLGLGIVGIGFGMFLGSWIIALGEVVNVFAVMARRIGLKKGTGLVILAIAIENPWMPFSVFPSGIKIRKCLILIP